jgi:uncharacterized secreted protein with C-terminal beta-propeller domain
MLSINKKIVKKWTSIITALSLMVISISVYSQDSTIYVKTNTNPFASPFYLFSNTPNGESINVTLEKGSTYTFIRTDGAHPFNIGDGWKQENSQIQYSSTGTGGVVGNTASIDIDEQLTITIPSDFNGSQLTYFCYPHSTMKSTFAVVEPSDNSADQPASWDFDGNGEADALTDGLLLLRYAFNLRDEALTNGAIASGSIMSSQEVQEAVTLALDIADIDANGEVDALTDGLLLLRYLFNLRGESLVNGAIASDASNSSYVDVEEYIASLMPGQILARASGLLVQMKSTQEFSANFTQSYSRTFGEVSDMVALEAMPETAMDTATSDSGGDSFTTTYTIEKTIDEHDFVKYDGEHLFIAPSYSMYEDCCFAFSEPIALFDDAIEVGEEPAVADEPIQPIIPELRSIKIMSTDSDQATVSEAGNILIDDNRTIEGLYTNGDQLASISTSGWWGMYGSAFMDPAIWRGQTTGVSVYDISNVSAPELDWKFEIEGGFVTSRKKGDIVYMVARHTPQIDYYIDYPTIEQRDANDELLEDVSSTDILPKAFINGEETDLLSATDCLMINDEHEYAPDQYGYPTMTLLVAVDVKNKQLVNTTCYLEPTSGVYVSQYAVYFIQSEGWGDDSRTLIHRFNLSSSLAYSGSGKVNGHLYGSGQMDFRINEHDGYLRVVSSQWTGDSEDNRDHQLTVLKHSPAGYSMDQVATLPNEEYPNEIGKPNEDLYGVRFFGDTLYLVTFERTDPLYVVDLSEQENPVIAGELEVTGFSDFLHPVNDDLLLGLGQDENGLVKLELFNVASMDNPVSLTALSIGEGSSWVHSPARYNRHAFTYQQVNDNQDRFTIPVTLSSNTAAGYTQENRLYMFNLFNKDVSDSASIMNSGFISGGSNNWWSNNDRQRSFIHNSTVFYVNDQNVIPSFWQYPED